MENDHSELSVRRQCEILSFNRSSLYCERIGLSEEDQRILEEMDKIYLDFPVYGSRRMSRELRRRGFKVGRQKARSLMRILGVEAIYPRKRLTFPDKEHQIYPYLLRGVSIDRPDVAYCKFRSIPATNSDSIRPLIPVDSGHPFRLIPDTFFRIPESAHDKALDNLKQIGHHFPSGNKRRNRWRERGYPCARYGKY